jgi:hypothetical protein
MRIGCRVSANNHLPPEQRQLCWALLSRDLNAIDERPGESAVFGAQLLSLQQQLLHHWHRYNDDSSECTTLQQVSRSARPLRPGCSGSCSWATSGASEHRGLTRSAPASKSSIWPMALGPFYRLRVLRLPTTPLSVPCVGRCLSARSAMASYPAGSDLLPPAHRHHQPQATGPRCLEVLRAGLGCPLPWRVDPVTAARPLNQQHRALLLDRSAMRFQAVISAAGCPGP